MNHISKVAEMLSVELEEFVATNNKSSRFKLMQDGLLHGSINKCGEEGEEIETRTS